MTPLIKRLKPVAQVMLLVFMFGQQTACKKEQEGEAKPGDLNTNRTMQEELDFVRSKAISLEENTSGYWEATFENELVMIYVPEGSFIMGNNAITSAEVDGNSPSPAHQVNLSHYWVAKTPVTKAQFRDFVSKTSYVTQVQIEDNDGPYVYDFSEKAFQQKQGYYWDNAFKDVTAKFPELVENDDHPVSCVSWYDCLAYTNWLMGQTGLRFTLPTEAEWERAARGMDERTYPWGNEVPDGTKANYADEVFDQHFPGTQQAVVHAGVNDGYAITSPVYAFPDGISPIGAYDMAGNLIEWVYDGEYNFDENSITNPINKSGERKLQKGGFWVGSAGRLGVSPNEIKDGHNIRSDSREGDAANSADDHLGFRIAISYVSR